MEVVHPVCCGIDDHAAQLARASASRKPFCSGVRSNGVVSIKEPLQETCEFSRFGHSPCPTLFPSSGHSQQQNGSGHGA
jgi:hypothetical protein